MGRYRISNVRLDNPQVPLTHTNIQAVGVEGVRYQYPVEQVAEWIETGAHSFYTTSQSGQHLRETEVCRCGQKSNKHIRSAPDVRADNSLECYRVNQS